MVRMVLCETVLYKMGGKVPEGELKGDDVLHNNHLPISSFGS